MKKQPKPSFSFCASTGPVPGRAAWARGKRVRPGGGRGPPPTGEPLLCGLRCPGSLSGPGRRVGRDGSHLPGAPRPGARLQHRGEPGAGPPGFVINPPANCWGAGVGWRRQQPSQRSLEPRASAGDPTRLGGRARHRVGWGGPRGAGGRRRKHQESAEGGLTNLLQCLCSRNLENYASDLSRSAQ